MEQEDRTLVEEAQAGGQKAFRELVCRFGTSILALSRSFLGDHAESEDVTQEAFMAAYQGLAKLREPERFSSWLYQITRNLCKRRLEVRGRRPVLHSLGSGEEGELLTGNPVGGVADRERGEEESPALAALMSLPKEYSLVLSLRHLEGLDLPRIAELCDLSVSGVNTRLYRGRKLLRQRLKGMEQ